MTPLLLEALAAPLLIVQGRRLRKDIPRLPEPDGPRAGETGDGPVMRVLIAGDSSAAGVGADHQDHALSGQFARRLAAAYGVRVRWQLVAASGLTTREVIALLDHAPLEPFDLAVTAVGVNDATERRSPARWLADVEALVGRLRAHAPQAHVLLSGLPPVHRFPALPQPLRTYLGARARDLDRALARWSSARPGTTYVPMPDMDEPALAAVDGFHPGPGAYAVWAQALVAALGAVPVAGAPGGPAARAAAAADGAPLFLRSR